MNFFSTKRIWQIAWLAAAGMAFVGTAFAQTEGRSPIQDYPALGVEITPEHPLFLFEYSGKMAIQNILEKTKTINVWDLVDLMFKDEFYNRSYVDYFRYYLEVMENV